MPKAITRMWRINVPFTESERRDVRVLAAQQNKTPCKFMRDLALEEVKKKKGRP